MRSGGDLLILYKMLHLLFFTLVRFLCALRLQRRKNNQHGLDAGPLEFLFLRPRDISPTYSEIWRFVSGSQAKHQVSSPVIILLEKIFVCIGDRDNILARYDSIFLLLRSRSVEQSVFTTFSFQNPLSESEELQSWGCSKILISFLMRLNGHF